jgi:hypothetical protein
MKSPVVARLRGGALMLGLVASACNGSPPGARGSYDVTASFTMVGRVPGDIVLPGSLAFSMTLDPRGLMFVGGGGLSQVVGTTTDGRTYRAVATVTVLPPQPARGSDSIDFNSLEVTPEGEGLVGTAVGALEIPNGNGLTPVALSATLTGGPDVTAPFLLAVGGIVDDPFAPVQVNPSEPIPVSATAALVGSDGTTIALDAQVDGELITTFRKPNVVLPLAEGYVASTDGLVDLAGNAGVGGAPLRIVSLGNVPLITDGGFESATGTVGEASIVGVAFDGVASAFIGGAGVPSLGGVAPGPRLFVRLPRRATDSFASFSYQIVAPNTFHPFPRSFPGVFEVGSVGRPPSAQMSFPAFDEPTFISMPTEPMLLFGGVHTIKVPLVDSVDGELVVLIKPTDTVAPVGVLIDDLRLE